MNNINTHFNHDRFDPVIETAHTTIIIADDHPLFRGALRQSIGVILHNVSIVEVGGFEELASHIREDEPADLILLDLTMPGVQGFSGLIYLRAQHPEIPVVIVSAHEDPIIIRRALGFGASGFIPKSLNVNLIGEALQKVLGGDIWVPSDIDLSQSEDREIAELMKRMSTLTPQQVKVLTMLSVGMLNKQIAFDLHVSEATIKAHVSAILQKLDVESRTQAVIAAAKIGIATKAIEEAE